MPKLIAFSFLILASGFLLLASCSADINENGFSKNPGPISANLIGALQDGEDPNSVPEVKRNFLEGCVTGASGSIPNLVAIQETGLLQVCGCSYESLYQYFMDRAATLTDSSASLTEIEVLAFRSFNNLDKDIQKGDEEFAEELLSVFEQCIRDSSPTISS
ncbi:MAG: hypothetical protein CL431_04040 [Acidimicrobiaceae bacterium]|jgi:hypothetical protein|nr:hypothetical protein [Acidimicrobiaceae bacterium]|tara:strand:+ start:3333 stop:3815 length:483 start_codon:yes stop_codon:yes gene_type:complete